MNLRVPTKASQKLSTDPGIRLAVAAGILILIAPVAGSLRLGTGRALLLLIAVVAVGAVRTAVAAGTAIGITAWMLDTGFVEHQYGLLTFSHADLGRLLILAATGTIVGTLSSPGG